MTNGQRTVTTLLVVIAVLLAINLAVTVPSHEAQAQGVGRPVEVVALQADTSFGLSAVYRMFSDGTVERNLGIPRGAGTCAVDWCGWEAIPEVPFVP